MSLADLGHPTRDMGLGQDRFWDIFNRSRGHGKWDKKVPYLRRGAIAPLP